MDQLRMRRSLANLADDLIVHDCPLCSAYRVGGIPYAVPFPVSHTEYGVLSTQYSVFSAIPSVAYVVPRMEYSVLSAIPSVAYGVPSTGYCSSLYHSD